MRPASPSQDSGAESASTITRSTFIAMAARFSDLVPHGRDLGMSVEWVGADEARLRLPFRDCLLGDTAKGRVYTSVLYSLADAASGVAVFCALGEFVSIATLDLRMDYLRPTPAGRDLVAEARCYRLSRQIAFTRCTLRLKDDDEIRAIATGTFICGDRRSDLGLPEGVEGRV